MPKTVTFDTQKRYIFTTISVEALDKSCQDFDAIIDTGAPFTEFSDEALFYLGFIKSVNTSIQLKEGLHTQKYGKVLVPKIEICAQTVADMKVYVSHFDKSWGFKAIIGLDFFRQFRTTIDFQFGQIITEPYKNA